jgi:predicted DNA-binding transcriptional regulator AlpA
MPPKPTSRRVRLRASHPVDPAVERAGRGGYVACDDAAEATAIVPDAPRDRGPPIGGWIDRRQLMARLPLSWPSIWKQIRAGKFPRPRVLGGKNLWPLAEVDAFLDALPRREYPPLAKPEQPFRGPPPRR